MIVSGCQWGNRQEFSTEVSYLSLVLRGQVAAANAGSKEWPGRQPKPCVQRCGRRRNHVVCEELHMIGYDLEW